MSNRRRPRKPWTTIGPGSAKAQRMAAGFQPSKGPKRRLKAIARRGWVAELAEKWARR